MADSLVTSEALDAMSEEIDSLSREKKVFDRLKSNISRIDNVKELRDYYQDNIFGEIDGVPEEVMSKLTDETMLQRELAHMYYVLSYDGGHDCGVVRYISANGGELNGVVKEQLRERLNEYTHRLTYPINFLEDEVELFQDYQSRLGNLSEQIDQTWKRHNNITYLTEKDAIKYYQDDFKPVETELEQLLEKRQDELRSYNETRNKWLEDLHTDFKTTHPVLFDVSTLLKDFYDAESEYDIGHLA